MQGGVGKTTLVRNLSNPNIEIPNFDYIQSPGVERAELSAAPASQLVAFPGQKQRWDAAKSEFQRVMSSKEAGIILNCVAYGYHSLSNVLIDEIRNERTLREAREQYFESCRMREVEQLRSAVPIIEASEKQVRMITCVLKQDLWWESKTLVKDFYESGDYNKEIRKMELSLGSSRFSHSIFGLSFHYENLMDGTKIIKFTSSGYDDRVRGQTFNKFLQHIIKCSEEHFG